MEACEFKCYAPYNFGTLVMDKRAVCGASVSDEAERQKARRAFKDAVRYSSNELENHMLPRVLNRNVSFLLQTTPNRVPDVNIDVPAEDIAEAKALLTSLERDVFPRFPTANWASTLYHLNKCDYYTRCGSFHAGKRFVGHNYTEMMGYCPCFSFYSYCYLKYQFLSSLKAC